LRKRLILLVPLLALFAFVAMTEERAEAADTTPPETTITSGPGDTSDGTAEFAFSSTESATTFKCKLVDQDSTRTDCITPKTYTNLTAGTTYTFKVWAKDAAGNIDTTPATLTFTSNGSGGTTPPPSSDWPASDCEKDIKPPADIDNIINSDPSGTATTFCVYAGNYTVSAPAILKAGDKLKGEPNFPLTPVGPANQPDPVVNLVASGSQNLLRANGNEISITWVDLSGADGTGNGTGAIAAGSAGSDFLVQFARIHENDSLGISSMKGTVLDSEFFKNSLDPDSLGFNASAVKGITAYQAGRVYVHDEQGNGLWCDVGCPYDLDSTTNGFWVHHSVVVNSGRAGIRYENSSSEALFQDNEIRGNGINEHRGGIDIRDSQDAQVLNNKLSANHGIGVRATDSGRSDRVNLERILVQGNDLGGDRIVTCGGQVVCVPNTNTNVGTR
jgi:hypothetical protein